MRDNIDRNYLYGVPVRALQPPTKKKLSGMLNRPKVLMSPPPDSYSRDYRGLGDLMGVNMVSNWFPDGDFVQHLLRLWQEEKPSESNLGKLINFFELIDRFDVIDDTYEMFVEDAAKFRDQPNEISYSPELPGLSKEILTLDDIQRYREGLPLRTYDAFLLYVIDDEEFAKKLITTLEGPRFNLHLCEKDRDLRGGIDIEWSAISTIILKRCRKLLVILSPEFLQSDYHTYFVQLTQSLTFHRKESHRVIPCLYKECPLSAEFQAYHILDFRRANSFIDVWQKLYRSIQPLEQLCNKSAIPQTQQLENNLPPMIQSDSYSVQKPCSSKIDEKVKHYAATPSIVDDISCSNGENQNDRKSTGDSNASGSSKGLTNGKNQNDQKSTDDSESNGSSEGLTNGENQNDQKSTDDSKPSGSSKGFMPKFVKHFSLKKKKTKRTKAKAV